MRYSARLPYRIDIAGPPPDALDLLLQFGALDVESGADGLAALLPDAVTKDAVARAFGAGSVTFSAAVARDSDSVWLLSPRAVRIGSVVIAGPEMAAPSNALRLIDSNAFGTGHHPTTATCIEALEEILSVECMASILDVGAGTGILALAALKMGVAQAVAIDIDDEALKVAAENAQRNNVADRLLLAHGGPDVISGVWPLVVANVLAAPLIELAPLIVQRVGSRGRLILSGIPCSVESEVRKAYQHLGMRHIDRKERAGWVTLIAQASW